MKEIDIKPSEKFPDGVAIMYTKEEAVEYNIKFHKHDNWREAQYGEYAETLDGYVTPIIKRNDRANPSYLKTPTGCFAISRSGTVFDTAEFVNRNSFTRKSRWNGKPKKLTANQVIFFDVFSRTLDIKRAVKLAYPNAKYESDVNHWIEQILASKLFKEYMKQFRQKFLDAGITEELLIKRLSELLPVASGGTFPALAKMGAAGLGVPEMFEVDNTKKLPSGADRPLFETEADEADFEDVKPRELTAVRKETD